MDKQIEFIERNLDVTRVGCKFSRVKSIERQSYRGRAARVIANGKAGHASTTDGLSDDQLIERASEMARVNVPWQGETGMLFGPALRRFQEALAPS